MEFKQKTKQPNVHVLLVEVVVAAAAFVVIVMYIMLDSVQAVGWQSVAGEEGY